MSLLAKQVIKNKCWVVEDDGKQVGSILADSIGVILVQGNIRERYDSLKALSTRANIIVDNTPTSKPTNELRNVYGFPCRYKAHDKLWDLRHKLPIFTKTSKSKSFFCAGYYIIQFSNGWVKSYCPKLITLTRYPYQGPYATLEEMRKYLKSANES